jgi:hypothetical protein
LAFYHLQKKKTHEKNGHTSDHYQDDADDALLVPIGIGGF